MFTFLSNRSAYLEEKGSGNCSFGALIIAKYTLYFRKFIFLSTLNKCMDYSFLVNDDGEKHNIRKQHLKPLVKDNFLWGFRGLSSYIISL